MQSMDLRAEERSAFKATVDTGLWDVLIAAVLSMLAIAPLLSGRLGDFWSAAVFVPVWGGAFLAVHLIKERVLVPRLGRVRWGPDRQARLRRFHVAMLTMNVVALGLGGVAFFATQRGAEEPWIYPAMLAVIVLLGFSSAAYLLNAPRLFLYGLLLPAGVLIGEQLFRQGRVSHHGFPVVFGTAALLIATVGAIKFALVLRSTRPVSDGGSTA